MSERWRSGSRVSNRNAKVRVSAVAGKQGGVLSVRQLASIGVGKGTVAEWTKDGFLHPLLPGVRAVGHRAIAPAGWLMASLLYAGPNAALSHTTAAAWWQLVDEHSYLIHVSTSRRCSSVHRVVAHGRRTVPNQLRKGLRVTTVPQTLLDYASIAPPERLRRVVAEADYRRLLNIDDIECQLGRGRRGARQLRAALDSHRPQLAVTRSVLEERFLALCEEAQIPAPEVNVKVAGLTVDAFWPDQRVVVELDGRSSHTRQAQFEKDRRRDLRLRRAGYIVIRYTWRQVVDEPQAVVDDLRLALTAPVPSAVRGSR